MPEPDIEPRGRSLLEVLAEESLPYGFAAFWLYADGDHAGSALGLEDRFNKSRIALWLPPRPHRIQLRQSLFTVVGNERMDSGPLHVTADGTTRITLTAGIDDGGLYLRLLRPLG